MEAKETMNPIKAERQIGNCSGFIPLWMPDFLFDFQNHLCEWSIRKGRGAIFADCGLGKTPMQLVVAENCVRKTNKPALILTPLAVSAQTVSEGEKFGIECHRTNDGKIRKCINVTNYERMHMFNPQDFSSVACDESSILKNYAGATRTEIIRFMEPVQHRFLYTATPSPNDYVELGNSVEALGIMRRVEMLANFFIHDSGDTSKWRLKGHAHNPFWRFVASWARAIRRPSDLGFPDGPFVLPELRMIEHILESPPLDGFLFPMEAVTLDEQRAERRQTIQARCARVAEIANASNDPFVAWCSLNEESTRLASEINGAVEITGSQSVEEKEELLAAFTSGQIRAVVSKPSICGFGMNWQHCNRTSFFPSHSHEQFYQCVRRLWRFGQRRPVEVHIVTTESESAVLANLIRKEKQATEMFDFIIQNMKHFYSANPTTYNPDKDMEIPEWLLSA
jgi:hypothetical protein